MKRYFNLYIMLLSKQFKTLSLYRADFLIGIVCLLLSFFTTTFAIWAIFQHTEHIGPWNRFQVTFAYGFNLTATGMAWLVFNQAWGIRDALISGHFIKYKIRPINPIFHFFAESLDIKSLLTIALGLGLMATHFHYLHLTLSANWLLTLILLEIASAALFSALIVVATGLAFWVTISNPLLGFFSSLQGLGHFPASIYNKALYIVLSTFVPVVFISYLPCSLLLGLQTNYSYLGYFLLVLCTFWAVAILLWKHGVQRYELPGT